MLDTRPPDPLDGEMAGNGIRLVLRSVVLQASEEDLQISEPARRYYFIFYWFGETQFYGRILGRTSGKVKRFFILLSAIQSDRLKVQKLELNRLSQFGR